MEEAVRGGHLLLEEASALASDNRNRQVVEIRAGSSPLSESIAKWLKKKGPSYKNRLEKYAWAKFKREFDSLDSTEQIVVRKEVLKAAGCGNNPINNLMMRLRAVAKL